MSRHNPKRFVPDLTALESREVPAVTSTQLLNGVVVVRCNDATSSVLVNQTATFVTVRDVTMNRAWSFQAGKVSRVDVFGGKSDDWLTSRGPGNGRMVRLIGQGGNDNLAGGNGREVLNGGAGNDVIKGAGAKDRLIGGDGDDWLHGGDGEDTLEGGNGSDWHNGGQGADFLSGGGGDDTLISIDNTIGDTLDPGLGFDILWTDKNGTLTDTVIGGPGAEVINAVEGFSNAGADRTLDGDRIPDPTVLSGDFYERFNNRPLFGADGPVVEDIGQGTLGDCWILAGLGAIALENQNVIRSNVVDFGDGTYGVHLGEDFYRVDNDLPVSQVGSQQLAYTALGDSGSLWVAIIEKAYTHHRLSGANSYVSIEGGFTFDLYQAFNLSGAGSLLFFQFPTAEALGAAIKLLFDQGKVPTVGIGGNSPTEQFNPGSGFVLLSNHQYIVIGYEVDGLTGDVTNVILRNPWGIDGGLIPSGDPNDGVITISVNTLRAASGICTLDFATV